MSVDEQLAHQQNSTQGPEIEFPRCWGQFWIALTAGQTELCRKTRSFLVVKLVLLAKITGMHEHK